jgi:hypothetical protein
MMTKKDYKIEMKLALDNWVNIWKHQMEYHSYSIEEVDRIDLDTDLDDIDLACSPFLFKISLDRPDSHIECWVYPMLEFVSLDENVSVKLEKVYVNSHFVYLDSITKGIDPFANPETIMLIGELIKNFKIKYGKDIPVTYKSTGEKDNSPFNAYKVIFDGFISKKEADLFAQWYECQGEMDSSYWLGPLEKKGLIRDHIHVDINREYEWKDNNLIVYIKS